MSSTDYTKMSDTDLLDALTSAWHDRYPKPMDATKVEMLRRLGNLRAKESLAGEIIDREFDGDEQGCCIDCGAHLPMLPKASFHCTNPECPAVRLRKLGVGK